MDVGTGRGSGMQGCLFFLVKQTRKVDLGSRRSSQALGWAIRAINRQWRRRKAKSSQGPTRTTRPPQLGSARCVGREWKEMQRTQRTQRWCTRRGGRCKCISSQRVVIGRARQASTSCSACPARRLPCSMLVAHSLRYGLLDGHKRSTHSPCFADGA